MQFGIVIEYAFHKSFSVYEGHFEKMKFTTLGASGLKVSKICFGCMSLGDVDNPVHPWAVGAEEGRRLIRMALEHGINFFDTANLYSGGMSETHLGGAA